MASWGPVKLLYFSIGKSPRKLLPSAISLGQRFPMVSPHTLEKTV